MDSGFVWPPSSTLSEAPPATWRSEQLDANSAEVRYPSRLITGSPVNVLWMAPRSILQRLVSLFAEACAKTVLESERLLPHNDMCV